MQSPKPRKNFYRSMRALTLLLFLLTIGVTALAAAETQRPRVLISTDIGGTDPDDNQSMIHLLMYGNEFDLEGLVSSPSFGDGSKEEILRMLEFYAKDRPALVKGLAETYGETRGSFPTVEYLTSIAKQGCRDGAPLRGYDIPTEGSEWIIECARRADERPLWVLVWGALEDVAQALHDAPDIADKIRIYWIGGPNKKWGVNAYNYVAENFPSLWFIENNASYRGFIGSSPDPSTYQAAYWPTFMKGAGVMGDDFINYYKGIAKMGDTPSLLYLMNGDPDNPLAEHWGGQFEPMSVSPRYIISGQLHDTDTVPCYSVLEWRLQGPQLEAVPDSACFTLTIDRQAWPGYYSGDGIYTVRYSPKAPARLPYTITSDLPGFPTHEGCLTVGDKWPAVDEYSYDSAVITPDHILLGKADGSGGHVTSWYTDVQDYSDSWQGSATIARWRNDIMSDWAQRFNWLKDNK